MDTNQLLIIIGAAAVLLAVIGVIAAFVRMRHRHRTAALQSRFGDEYGRTVADLGRGRAEKDLAEREHRAKEIELHPLAREDARMFMDSWDAIQARFVDAPADAVARANQLIAEVLRGRGYPAADFEKRVGDVSVQYPRAAVHYREGTKIAIDNQRQEASTEDLRQAMVHFRAILTDLVEVGDAAPRDAGEPAPIRAAS